MIDVYLGLGSNMGDRAGYLKSAVERLSDENGIKVVKLSSIYQTDPIGPISQEKYLNAVVHLATELAPHELLDRIQKIELELGRIRAERWGPRTLDIDLLLYGNSRVQSDQLRVPHPELWNRAFVLAPLAEIQPNLEFEARSVRSHLSELGTDGVTQLIPFSRSETVGIAGASSKPDRYSNKAQRMLMDHGHSVIPVSLKDDVILGVPCFRSFASYQGKLDTITMYLSPERQKPLIPSLLAVKPRRIIFNPGSESPESQTALEKVGIQCEFACTLVLLQTDQFS